MNNYLWLLDMKWIDVIENPILKNLPFKIELNRWGQIIMTPKSNKDGVLKARVSMMLNDEKRSGTIILGCSIETPRGVKVADIAWLSDMFTQKQGLVTPYAVAPEICVDVVSPSNSKAEMNEKIKLYLEQGALEVWLCNQSGSAKH
jgi:Uma2 family endonuclease